MDVPAARSIATIIFPLSSDHLIVLLQYNVLRGSLLNRKLLDQISTINTHLHSSKASTDLHVFPPLSSRDSSLLPPSLHPTLLQKSTSHPHWIDIIPHPVFRDNLIKASGHFDEDQLWSDVVGGLFEGFPDDEVEARGIVMWETPWLWEGWELSEGFVKSWGWLLGGGQDVLGPTNKWREMRGEVRIAIEACD